MIISVCKVDQCNGSQCLPPKQMYCMDQTSAKNYGKNFVSTEAYIQELQNLLNTLTTPVK